MVSADYLVVRIVVGRVVVVILSSVGLLGCGDKTLFSRNCSVAWRDASTFPQRKHAPKVSIKWRVHRIMFPLVLLMPEWSSRYYLSLPPSSGNPPLSRCYGASRKGEGMDNRRGGGGRRQFEALRLVRFRRVRRERGEANRLRSTGSGEHKEGVE